MLLRGKEQALAQTTTPLSPDLGHILDLPLIGGLERTQQIIGKGTVNKSAVSTLVACHKCTIITLLTQMFGICSRDFQCELQRSAALITPGF